MRVYFIEKARASRSRVSARDAAMISRPVSPIASSLPASAASGASARSIPRVRAT